MRTRSASPGQDRYQPRPRAGAQAASRPSPRRALPDHNCAPAFAPQRMDRALPDRGDGVAGGIADNDGVPAPRGIGEFGGGAGTAAGCSAGSAPVAQQTCRRRSPPRRRRPARPSPAGTRISASTPVAGRGHLHRYLVGLDFKQIVAGSIGSPVDLNHCVIFPSATVSPSCGISTSIAAYHASETYWVSMNSISPSCAPSRPMPDCFIPPKGAAGSDTSPRLSPTMPKSSCSETRMPRLRSLV